MLLFIICEPPPKNSTFLRPFLAIFTLFQLKNWPYLQKPEFGNLAKTRFWFLLVNNSLCSIPLSWARSYIKETPGDRCVIQALQQQNCDAHFSSSTRHNVRSQPIHRTCQIHNNPALCNPNPWTCFYRKAIQSKLHNAIGNPKYSMSNHCLEHSGSLRRC